MNRFKGYITDLETHNHLNLVKVDVNGIKLTSIILCDDSYAPKLGEETEVLFKETEVTLGLDQNLAVSQQNQLPGEITALEKGKLLARVSINTICGPINAIVTANAVEQLQLKIGNSIKALIKTNELMLSN